MPPTAKHSPATKKLVADLNARGYKVGCRAVEHWAERGLAPAPVRYPLGKHGFSRRYPVGAVDRYAAVASVMRRGRDWRLAGLMLIGQGHLPAREATFRFLLDFLIPIDLEVADDPLAIAEEEFKQFAGSPFHGILDRIIKRNLTLAKITDPVTGKDIHIDSVTSGVITQILAALLGAQLPDGAAEEIAAAWGLIEEDLSGEERAKRVNFVEAIFAALTFEELSRTVQAVIPAQLQAVVIELRQIVDTYPINGLELIPKELLDIFLVITGLTIATIEDLGGLAWFQSMGALIDVPIASHGKPA
jgi:hypothetical protein